MEEKTLFPREEKSEILFKKISEDKWACEKLMETFCSYLFSNDGVDLPDSPSSTEFVQALFNSYRNRDLSAFLMAICQNTVFDLLRNAFLIPYRFNADGKQNPIIMTDENGMLLPEYKRSIHEREYRHFHEVYTDLGAPKNIFLAQAYRYSHSYTSDDMEPGENVEYLLEWDVNDAFYDFPFVGNSVTFEKTAPETMNVAYDEDLYQKDLEYFETILGSFSLDINSVSMDSILEHFKSGKTLCAFVNTDSLQKLDDISYSVMEIPALNEELPSIGCASTDMFVVNDFSKNTDQAADFADFVTVRLTDRLHDMSGHYSVFLSQTADDAEKTAYQAYEDAVLLPDSQDAKDFWVGLKEKIAEYF